METREAERQQNQKTVWTKGGPTMTSHRVNRVALLSALTVLVLWTGGAWAAPMECHFNSRAQCVFAGRNYSLGETWMDDACLQCTCLHPIGVGCCETVHRPVDFPPWCVVRVEPVTCRVALVRAADPRLPCSPGEHSLDPSHGSLRLQQRLEV